MAENSGELLEPDMIISNKDGESRVSLIKDGKVLPENPNSDVREGKDERGGLSVNVRTGKIIRGRARQSGASQAELQANFKPLIPQKTIKK